MEPNHRADDGTNPTEQIHSVTVPGIPMTSDWTDNFEPQSVTFPVTVANDSRYEPTDYLTAEILPSATNEHDSRSRAKFRILDDDRSTIALSANSTAVTEGDPLVFTLTRGNNTAVDLIVGVSVLDPGGFLAGNLRSEAVEAPSSVIFAPGDVAASVNLTPPDDWRDIPDSTLTFTVTAEPEYEITGPASITVPVADNDVAPQVQISFNAAEVDEGQDLVILTITRTGDDKNPLEIGLTTGPQGHQSIHGWLRHGRRPFPACPDLQPDRRRLQGPRYGVRGHPAPRSAGVLDPGNRTSHRHREESWTTTSTPSGSRPSPTRSTRGRTSSTGCTTTDIPETG